MRHRAHLPGITALLSTGLLLLSSTFANAGLSSMRGQLFSGADEARTRAEAEDAAMLAPVSYSEAISYYQRADATFKRAGSVDSIRSALTKAEKRFKKAAASAEVANVAFDSMIQARQDALSSNAASFAEDDWDDAESNFREATSRLDRGSIKYAQRYADKAEASYRAGELAAIKANYLNETRALIEDAEKLRAERYAPLSLNNARILLETAETELNNNRYDTDRPRSLAVDAKHNALHAIYISKLEQKIRDRGASLETILLEWEASIGRIGDALDKPVYFDRGEAAAIEELLKSLNTVKQSEQTLSQDLADRDAQLTSLNEQVSKMQELLGGGNQTIEELEELLAEQARHLEQQERHRGRFVRVEALFESNQATVLRQGDTVIIRMIGLNFDSGTAELKQEHVAILERLEQAISEFPESQVVVEGHTDAFGSDQENLQLSQARADSVVRHLLTSLPISPVNLDSMGYGESRPVANNETPEGRKRNRRIDVVIEPSWVTRLPIAQITLPDVPLNPAQ